MLTTLLLLAAGMVVVDENAVRVREPAPHGAVGQSTAYRISDAVPAPREMEFRKRVLDKGAAIGPHLISHDEVYYVLAGSGEVTADGEVRKLTSGMAAYLYKGSNVGIRQVGRRPLALIISYPTAVTYTREALDKVAASYFKAIETHTMSALPVAANIRITENAVQIKPGEGFINTGGKLLFRRTIIDTQNCGTLTQAVVAEGTGQAVLAVRLRVVAGKVTEMETIIARKGDLNFKPEGLIESADQDWTTFLPVAARRSREQMNAAADGYYLMFQDHQLAPPFANPCRRWENGRHNPAQVECAWTGAVTRQPARRYPVTDPELGVSAAINNFSGRWLDVHIFKFDSDGRIAIIQAVDGPVTQDTGWEPLK